jgi:hypothetical protein
VVGEMGPGIKRVARGVRKYRNMHGCQYYETILSAYIRFDVRDRPEGDCSRRRMTQF